MIAKLDGEHRVQRDGGPVVGKGEVAVKQKHPVKHRVPPLREIAVDAHLRVRVSMRM